jgi:hypothetical protein
MNHKCDAECICRHELDAADTALAEASRRLSDSILSGSDETIENYYASFRAAKAKFCVARADYLDHRLNHLEMAAA